MLCGCIFGKYGVNLYLKTGFIKSLYALYNLLQVIATDAYSVVYHVGIKAVKRYLHHIFISRFLKLGYNRLAYRQISFLFPILYLS